eukprot:2499936-Pyramimonas_sp.AAC.1
MIVGISREAFRRIVAGPHWVRMAVLLKRSWGFCCASWAVWEASWAILAASVASQARLGSHQR